MYWETKNIHVTCFTEVTSDPEPNLQYLQGLPWCIHGSHPTFHKYPSA